MATESVTALETTRILATFAATLRYEAIPEEPIRAIKKTLLDALGLGLVGSAASPSKEIGDFVIDLGGPPQSTLWGRGVQVPAVNAALALAPTIYAYGFDDVHSKIHPASVVVSSAFAVAEREGASGRDLLTALVAGYETLVRIGRGVNTTRSFLKGWRVTGTCGPFGAAAAVGRLIGLDPEWMTGAFGLAGTQSAGLFSPVTENSVHMRFDPGRASQSGVMAADLAKRGVGGSRSVIEAEHGGLFQATSDGYDLDVVTNGLGTVYLTPLNQNKVHPVPMSLLSAAEAAMMLRTDHGIRPEQIEAIVLRTSLAVIRECGDPFEAKGPLPSQQLRGMLSAAYVLPAIFVDGTFTLDHFRPESLASPAVAALSRLVRCELHDELDRRYPEILANIVDVHLKDGRVLTQRVDYPHGTPKNPVTFDEIKVKFRDLARRSNKSDVASEIIQMVEHLEDVRDVRALAKLLA